MINYSLDFKKYSDSSCLLLTPNQRLARKLIDASQAQVKSKVLLAINVKSLNDFINYIFDTAIENGLLQRLEYSLNNWQQELLFKQIINDYSNLDNTEYSGLIVTDSLVKKVVSAWNLAIEWELDWLSWPNYLQTEASLFSMWAERYKEYLESHSLCDPAYKIKLLINLLNSSEDKIKTSILNIISFCHIDIYGFDDLSPSIRQLLSALENAGIKITNLEELFSYKNQHSHSDSAIINEEQRASKINSSSVQIASEPVINLQQTAQLSLYKASNQEDEYKAVACWAKHHLLNSQNDIGIIVPSLSTHRDNLIRVFEEIIPNRQAWNISGGDNLSEVSVIKAALILLDIIIYKKIELIELRYLLKSNYYKKPEGSELALDGFIRDLTNRGYISISLKELVNYLSPINPILCSVFESDECQITDEQKLPSQWAIILSNLLASLSWPAGATNINSLEFQAINQWQGALGQLVLLDPIFGSKSITFVYKELKLLLGATPFQIQTDDNRIDILGMLEGAGVQYNKLWLFGFSSDVWPASPEPSPFIPLEVQKKYKLPHASSERELDYAKRFTNRYLKSSSEIVVSYTAMQDDREMELSPLFYSNRYSKLERTEISDFDVIHRSKHTAFDTEKTSLNNLFNIKTVDDSNGPKITKAHIKSGVKALSLQAACPFWAFAETRLNSGRKYQLSIGPAPWLRGQIIHKVLELIFTKYSSYEKLSDFINKQEQSQGSKYNQELHDFISLAIKSYSTQYKNIFTAGIKIIETELIFNIVDKWLNIELERGNYEVVALEQQYLLKLNNIQFNVRVDRVDRIIQENNGADRDNGEIVIIDYKTSKQNINNLLHDDIVDPQLPVYLFIDKLQNVQAVLYAEVLEEGACFKGLSNSESKSSKNFKTSDCKTVENWQSVIANWQQGLNQLADDYVNGNALINPVNKAQTCMQCHLSTLCRKDEVLC